MTAHSLANSSPLLPLRRGYSALPEGAVWHLEPVLQFVVGLDELAARLKASVQEHLDDLDHFGVLEYEISGVRAAFWAYRPHRQERVTLRLDGFGLARTGQDAYVLAQTLLQRLGLQDLVVDWVNPNFPYQLFRKLPPARAAAARP